MPKKCNKHGRKRSQEDVIHMKTIEHQGDKFITEILKKVEKKSQNKYWKNNEEILVNKK